MNFESFAFWLAGGMGACLLLLVAWVGSRMQQSVDELRAMLDLKLTTVSQTLASIEKDIRHELGDHDTRITVLESKQ